MTSNSNILPGVILSIIIHGFAFIQFEVDFSFENKSMPVEGLSNQINIQLVKYVKPVAKTITDAIARKTNVKPAIKKKSFVKTKPEEQLNAIDEVPVAEVIEKKAQPEAQGRPEVTEARISQQVEIDPEKERQAYIQLLLAHIERYKFYPGAARRRSIEGKLDVSFYLQPDGGHHQLLINGGRAVLQRAVRQALEDAQPYPEPPSSLQMDQRIAFSMYYQLE